MGQGVSYGGDITAVEGNPFPSTGNNFG